MPVRRWFMRIHGWMALIAGVQMLLWVVSGLVMAWFPIDTVRGRHLVRETAPRLIDPAEPLAPLSAVIAQIEGGATQATLRFLLDAPVLEIQRTDGSVVLADARTGTLLPPLDEAQARAVAEADFAGAGTITDAVLLDHPKPEDRTAAPVWRVQFDDPDATRVFVSPQTGKVVARRTATWRLYDFFWMLHIMDYGEREDFNHPLIIVFAALSTIVAFTGLPLLWWQVIAPRFRRARRASVRDD